MLGVIYSPPVKFISNLTLNALGELPSTEDYNFQPLRMYCALDQEDSSMIAMEMAIGVGQPENQGNHRRSKCTQYHRLVQKSSYPISSA